MSELLIITIGYAVSIAVGLGFGLFVLLRAPQAAANQLFFLMCVALAGFQLSFVLGANTADPQLAYRYWFFNLVDVFLALFYLHFIVLALDAYARFRYVLYAAYAIGLSILCASLAYPALFLPRVVPKLYFLNYLDGGPLYAAMLAFFLLSFLLSFAVMFLERARHSDEGKRRVDYYIFSLFYGFASGVTAFPLVFNYPVDPLFSMLIGTFTIPMVYGMIKKDLLDIRIVFRRTVLFTGLILAATLALSALSLLSRYLENVFPGFAIWIVPFATAISGTSAGYLYWRKGKEAEALKYEFINVATHKFRTPLTRIKWTTETLLSDTTLTPPVRTLVEQLRDANTELIELANLLVDAARMEKEQYAYAYTDLSLTAVAHEVLAPFTHAMQIKRIALTTDLPDALPPVRADKERLASAIHVFIENAVAYTPEGGTIRVAVANLEDALKFSVTDSGIGIAPDDRARIFKKFYRSLAAHHADTEGVGLGLSMAKNIIERQRGTVGFESAGVGQGSTFWFTLPISTKHVAH